MPLAGVTNTSFSPRSCTSKPVYLLELRLQAESGKQAVTEFAALWNI